MGFMTDFTGKYSNFAKSTAMGVPKTAATADADRSPTKRVDRRILENYYLTDPQTFNTVNKTKQLIMQAGYHIVSDTPGGEKPYVDFLANIGTVGLRMNQDQLLDSIIHDGALHGHAYVERIYNAADTEIVDLKMVDSKLMDYARDNRHRIMTNEEQNPLGYTMFVGSNYMGFEGDEPPEGINLQPDSIYLEARRIADIKLFSYGNRFEAVGLVEPADQQIFRKHKIEDAVTNSIHNTAAYPIMGFVGSDTRHATKKQMESTLEALENLQHSRYMVFENPTEVKALEVKHSDQADSVLRYLRTEQSAASGMALGFSVGTGEAINRSTLGTQQRMLDISLESVAQIFANQFNKLI